MSDTLPRAFERIEDHDENGTYSVLYAEDAEGEIKLDEWKSDGSGDAADAAAFLNANPDELARDIVFARTKTGPWTPKRVEGL